MIEDYTNATNTKNRRGDFNVRSASTSMRCGQIYSSGGETAAITKLRLTAQFGTNLCNGTVRLYGEY